MTNQTARAGYLDCQLVSGSFGQHLNQIYAGFAMLARRGLVGVTATQGAATSATAKLPKMEVRLNGKLRLIYDKADGATFFEEDLAACDLYFKRSYDPSVAAKHEHGHKVLPLGLSYCVYRAEDYWVRRMWWLLSATRGLDLQWALRQSVRSSVVLSRLANANNGKFNCQLDNIEGFPVVADPPQVILFTQTYDPADTSQNPAEAEERQIINEMRASCIRQLRAAHGRHFVGGFAPNAYAQKHYADCVVADPRQTYKTQYLRLMHQSSICVATMGLLESNGSRLGEYVTAAKAIVSERLHFQATGDFEPGQNYLEFSTPEACVAATVALAEDPEKRRAMMERNYEYYHAYLRPDVLVWRTLQTAAARFPGL